LYCAIVGYGHGHTTEVFIILTGEYDPNPTNPKLNPTTNRNPNVVTCPICPSY